MRDMKKRFEFLFISMLSAYLFFACTEFPVDEDGLLITPNAACYVSNFDLLDTDFRTVKIGNAKIDTLNCTINVTVFYGTQLNNLWPSFTLETDCKLDPKVTSRVDFSDLNNPKQYDVISGNRKVKKKYTVYIQVQEPS